MKFLKKFSYETRISSREFCEALVSESIDIDHLQSTDKLSEIIIDRPWFFYRGRMILLFRLC